MGRVNRGRTIFFILLIAVITLGAPTLHFCTGGERRTPRPERAIAVYPEFSGVIVSKGEAVRMDL